MAGKRRPREDTRAKNLVMPKSLVAEMEQYALDNGMWESRVATLAIAEFLKKNNPKSVTPA